MLRYATATEECRSKVIEEYFGSEDAKPCGVCDVCRAKRASKINYEDIDNQILSLVANESLSVKDIVKRFSINSAIVVQRIDNLFHEGEISVTDGGKLKIIE